MGAISTLFGTRTPTNSAVPISDGSGLPGASLDAWVTDGSGGSGGGPTVDENRYFAVLATLLRPSKIKWKIGSFGAFTPSERIYIKVANLVRYGANVSIYTGGLYTGIQPEDFTILEAGETVTAHSSISSLAYVTETDVAAVVNPMATYYKLMAYLTRDATITHYQARQAGTGSGGAAKTGSAITAITPGTYGSIILEADGQGYENDVIGTVSAVDYVVLSLADKGALNAGGVDDQWVHQWRGVTPLFLPIAATMDGNSFGWGIKAYTAFVTYDGVINARVATLPSNWDTDSTESGGGGGGGGSGVSYVPLTTGAEPVQLVSDGAGQLILTP
jgi:hypothetical protein